MVEKICESVWNGFPKDTVAGLQHSRSFENKLKKTLAVSGT